ncbi:ABC transporter substrate-binding protein [uncultured Paracoccus sp.]|uniref:ABC transporter substrate-binding protein n=1 Tax=uncultured Paracoccus sp. TaxID=189685 RepID=UPI0025EC6561|nr:ABC transporter substrate-binding protein [uncultured Paracoccus sp.]
MIKPFAFALMTIHAVAGAALAEEIAVTHAQGETVLQAVPQSVMVTDWAAFDILTALGVPVEGVPASVAPGHLADKVTDEMQRIGSLQEPDIEGIAAAAPDLVIIGGRSRTSYGTISRLAPVIDISVTAGR